MNLPRPADLLPAMARELQEHLRAHGIENPCYIGIHSGGVWVAQALLQALGSDAALGTLTHPSIATTSARTACIPRSGRRPCPLQSTASTWC